MQLLWICVGGAFGSGARYLLSAWMLERFGPAFPWGTVAVNVIGSFLLAFILQLAVSTNWISPTLKLALTTGVMGGFTTYSTFNQDTLRLAQEGNLVTAAGNVALTIAACLLAGLFGLTAARAVAS